MTTRELMHEIEGRIDELRRDVMRTWGDFRFHEEPRAGEPRIPACDIVEQADAFNLTVELPGISKKEVTVDVDEHGARVRAEHKEETKETKPGYVRRERMARSFDRYVRFPEPVAADGARATFVNGVLDLHVPKANPEKRNARRVEIV